MKNKFSSILNIAIGLEKEYFIENLAALLGAGIGILSALEAIKEEARSSRMKKIIGKMEEEINSGLPLWKTIENAEIFPSYAVSLIKLGEKSGKLTENFAVLAKQQAKNRNFRLKLRSAMIYPALVLSLTIIVGLGSAWFILPQLATMFYQLDIELPFITRLLIAAGVFLQNYGMIFVPAFTAFLLLSVYFIFFFKKTKIAGQFILFKLPGIRNLILEIELGRSGYMFGSLLSAGLPIIDILTSLEEASFFYAYKDLFAFLAQSVKEGNSFQKSFRLYENAGRIIPAPIQQLIVSGEQSGRLPETFIKIGEMFEEKTEITTKNLTAIMEPLILIVIWAGVLTVSVSVVLPIYRLVGGISR